MHDMPTTLGTQSASRVLDWLTTTPSEDKSEELIAIRGHLNLLRESPPENVQLQKILDLLYRRSQLAESELMPKLIAVRLPLASSTRRAARTLQEVLELLARIYLDTANQLTEKLMRGLHRPLELTVWRAVDAFARHLLISDLISAPPTPGIWKQLHQAASTAEAKGLATSIPEGATCSIRDAYCRALLLGCGQPSAFTAQEWNWIAHFAERSAHLVTMPSDQAQASKRSHFWFNPAEDYGPIPAIKRPPSDNPYLVHFSCEAILDLLEAHKQNLLSSVRTNPRGISTEIPSRLAGNLIERLRGVWGHPRKRHFQRRRQGYRARLWFGFDAICELLRAAPDDATTASEWMVTNESPGGYSAMHVSGRLNKVQNGDIIALRAEDAVNWQIGIIRWALSENPEHLEIGIQIVTPVAQVATLAIPGTSNQLSQPVLYLPSLPPLRTKPALATAPGLLMENSGPLLVVMETGNLGVREIQIKELIEQSPDVDILAVDPIRGN